MFFRILGELNITLAQEYFSHLSKISWIHRSGKRDLGERALFLAEWNELLCQVVGERLGLLECNVHARALSGHRWVKRGVWGSVCSLHVGALAGSSWAQRPEHNLMQPVSYVLRSLKKKLASSNFKIVEGSRQVTKEEVIKRLGSSTWITLPTW